MILASSRTRGRKLSARPLARGAVAALLLAAGAAAWDRTHHYMLSGAAVAGLGNPARWALLYGSLSKRFDMRAAVGFYNQPAFVAWRDAEDAGACLTLIRSGQDIQRIWFDESLGVRARFSSADGEHLVQVVELRARDRDRDGRLETLCQLGGRFAVIRLTDEGPQVVGAWRFADEDNWWMRVHAQWVKTPRGDYELALSDRMSPTLRAAHFRWTRPSGTLSVPVEVPFALYALDFPDDAPWRDMEQLQSLLFWFTPFARHAPEPTEASLARWKLLSPEPGNLSASPARQPSGPPASRNSLESPPPNR